MEEEDRWNAYQKRSNRTFMELKFRGKRYFGGGKEVLIAPLWN